jgi:hypothetical protein
VDGKHQEQENLENGFAEFSQGIKPVDQPQLNRA